MSQFTLTINLGNDAMQTGYDVMQQLRDVAYIMQDHGDVTRSSVLQNAQLKTEMGTLSGTMR